ncbi:hypothetical protein Q9R32_04735 [Actinotalea sp. AC32]|nr:hypothetical protein [Actinotalea sp. AC32]
MPTVSISPSTLSVSFSLGERVAGLLRDQHVPTSAVTGAEVVPDGLAALRGLRAPGLGLPGVRGIGTWRRRHGGSTLASVRAGRPALRVTLRGQRWAELLLDVDRPEQVAARLTGR